MYIYIKYCIYELTTRLSVGKFAKPNTVQQFVHTLHTHRLVGNRSVSHSYLCPLPGVGTDIAGYTYR